MDMLENTKDMLKNTKDMLKNTKDILENTKEIPKMEEIRELLKAYKLTGIKVVLFLQSFRVVGYITKVGIDFVSLQQDQVESNANGGDLENAIQFPVKISDIVAISDYQPKKSGLQI